MRFGFCVPAEQSVIISGLGYDYLEWPLAPTLTSPPNTADLGDLAIKPEAFNVFLPGNLKVVGEDVDQEAQIRYLQKAFAYAASVGGKIVVFGSGRSRGVPEGFSRPEAARQTLDFLRLCAPLAAAQGVTVAIEPLNRAECNSINSVAEACGIAEEVAHPALGVLSDLYHVTVEGQSFEETRAAGTRLKHIHVAGAEGRRVPNGLDLEYLARFFAVLKESGYAGRVSVEGTIQDLPREAEEALDVLHRAWEMS